MSLTESDINRLRDVFATKDEMLTFHDRTMKKLEDILIEQKMTNHALRRYDDKLENHEKRIYQLETVKA